MQKLSNFGMKIRLLSPGRQQKPAEMGWTFEKSYDIITKICIPDCEVRVMIKIENLNKFYESKRARMHHALKDVNLVLPDKGLVFVLGKSGSGKSTFLNMIGGLDSASSGRIVVDGNDISHMTESQFVHYRNSCIGFIFQDHHLIDDLTLAENIQLVLDLRHIRDEELVSEALEQGRYVCIH